MATSSEQWTERLTRILLISLILLLSACGRIIQVQVVTPPAADTPVPPTPLPSATPGQAVEPTSTEVPPSETPANTPLPSETPVPLPTHTPEPAATRVQFQAGATSASLPGHVPASGLQRYVLGASAGQTMEIMLHSANEDALRLAIWGADGTILKGLAQGGIAWCGALPATQDYYIDVVSAGAEANYELGVIVYAHIRFQPGATSARMTGHVAGGGIVHYVLSASAGQKLAVYIASPNGDVLLSIVGADGVPLKRHVDDRPGWEGQLHATQDYYIKAVSVGGTTDFDLDVSTSALPVSEPVRIQFPSGATSVTREGNLPAGGVHRFVLRAQAGQRMEVCVVPVELIDLSVMGENGAFWSVPTSQSTLTIDALPATQDYVITLTALPSTGTIGYTMDVTIPPP